MSSKKSILCIYCKDQKPSSKEHVLQAAIGGNLTIPDVCEDCNEGFSKIDQSLAENSLLSMVRVGLTPEDSGKVKLGGQQFHFDEKSGLWCDVELVNRIKPVVLPQIHWIMAEDASVLVHVTADEETAINSLLDLIEAKIGENTLKDTFIKIGPEDRLPTTRIVKYRKKELYVRARTKEEGEQFLGLLEKNWSIFKSQVLTGSISDESCTQPKIQHMQSICLNDCYRAIAKSAFNFLSFSKGPDFVLRGEFDPIRDYIRGISIQSKCQLAEGEIDVDLRFVTEVSFVGGSPLLVPTSSHAVAIFYDAPKLYALVTLYGQYEYIVTLGEISLHDTILIVHEFSIDKTTNNTIQIQTLAQRIKEHTLHKKR